MKAQFPGLPGPRFESPLNSCVSLRSLACLLAGPIAALGDFIGGQLQFYVFMVMVVNFLIASLICFSALCMYLVQSRVLGFVNKRHGIGAAVFLHVLATVLCILGLAGDDIVCSAILQKTVPLCSRFFGLFLTVDYKLKVSREGIKVRMKKKSKNRINEPIYAKLTRLFSGLNIKKTNF